MRNVVARHWPAHLHLDWRRVGGGFSGALVFAGSNEVALKGWPHETGEDRVAFSHDAQRCVESLAFVPRLIPAASGRTWVEDGGRFWELSAWRPGRPATAHEAAWAGEAIAALHRAWTPGEPEAGECPVAARSRHVREVLLRLAPSRDPLAAELLSLATRAATALAVPFPGKPCRVLCHGDLHGDHVLFDEGRVSGVIDFASVKPDHPALDLARYFGEIGAEAMAAGVESYRKAGGFREVTLDGVRHLDRVITLGAAGHWLQRLSSGRVTAAEAARVERLMEKLRQVG